ncbi:MAG: potassium transporter TrkA [Bacteroidota bacterium]|nr:potassium transporter TrkA [Bacteroidota bacterium]
MSQPTFKEKARYYFENTMSAGPSGVIKWLAIFSLFMVLILGLLILVFGIKSSPEPEAENLGFIEGAWQSLMATLDSGTMGGDEGWAFRAVRFIATLGGIFLISILIGTISSGIDEKLDELKKGRSRVLESNHTLILGWSEKVYSIISEIIEANENQKKPSVVILADRDKSEMEDEIRGKIENFKNTKLIVRSGSPLESTNIALVNPNEARSIIVLAGTEDNADTYVIKSVLALTNGKNRKESPYSIVAEIKDPKNMEAAELVGNDETVFVMSSDLISRITAQTCRQSGLSIVYSELLQFEGDEIYFQEEPKLVGKKYKDSLLAYERSSVIGLFTKGGSALINPPMDTVINKGDKVIAISEDDDTVVLSGKTSFDIDEKLFSRSELKAASVEKTLILGWNARGIRIIEELDNYVAKGSEVLIVEDGVDIEEEIAELQKRLDKQKIKLQKGNINDKATLVSLKPEIFDHIILLSYTDIDTQESDAKTLICLLHLRNLSEKAGKDFSIVSEMLDIRNRDLGVVAKADDFIVSDNLISLMLSQLSENQDLKKVYDVLFQAEGSEVYLKPVSKYVKPGQPVNFYTVIESAAQLNESAIGYRISSLNTDSDQHFGVNINPDKAKKITFSENDFIIVLAED